MNATRPLAPILAAGLAVVAAAAPRAAAQAFNRHLRMDAGAEYRNLRCLDPCDCVAPPITGPVTGLTVVSGADRTPLITVLPVLYADWTVAADDGRTIRLTGSGVYTIDEMPIASNRLWMDLSIDGDPPRRFDSGIVPLNGPAFPVRLDLTIGTPIAACQQFFVDVRASWACPVDWDVNGAIQPADVAAFIAAWVASLQGGSLAGDFNGDGAVLPSDVAAFVNAWFDRLANGCPPP
jgi:hypothetical protein